MTKMQKQKERVALISIASSGLLAIGKFVIGGLTGSIGLISDGAHPEWTLTCTTHCDLAGTNVGRGLQQFRFVQDFQTLVGPWSLNIGANDGV
jgi:hypothetical protein